MSWWSYAKIRNNTAEARVQKLESSLSNTNWKATARVNKEKILALNTILKFEEIAKARVSKIEASSSSTIMDQIKRLKDWCTDITTANQEVYNKNTSNLKYKHKQEI